MTVVFRLVDPFKKDRQPTDHDALYRLLAAESYDIGPDSPDRFIIRWIVRPASQADDEMTQPYVKSSHRRSG